MGDLSQSDDKEQKTGRQGKKLMSMLTFLSEV